MAHPSNPSTGEAEVWGSLWVPGQPGLLRESASVPSHLQNKTRTVAAGSPQEVVAVGQIPEKKPSPTVFYETEAVNSHLQNQKLGLGDLK